MRQMVVAARRAAKLIVMNGCEAGMVVGANAGNLVVLHGKGFPLG